MDPIEQKIKQLQVSSQPKTPKLEQYAKGVGQEVLSVARNVGTFGSKIASGLTGGYLQGADVYRPGTAQYQKATEFLTPKTPLEKAGKTSAQIAEFFLPGGKAVKAEKYVNLISQGIKSKKLAALTRIAGKSAVQGLTAGGVTLAQTGDIKQAEKTALGAGIIRGGFATIGEGIRAMRLPERLYSTIFKNTSDDMLQELRTEAFARIKQTDPAKFENFVKRGLVHVDDAGNVAINPTVAKQALDAGLKGNIRNMTRTVIEGTLDSETKVQDILANYTGKVNLKEPQFERILRSIAEEYQDVGFNEISDEALTLANEIKNSGGGVSGQVALNIRRLLDKARIASSFEKPVSKLSLTQANLKTLADAVRGRLNAIPGLGETMKNYSFYIEALETLSKEAARRGNTQALGLIDSLFLSGAFGATSPLPGFTAGLGRKLLMSGPGITRTAQFLNKGTASPTTIGATGLISKNLQSLLGQQ